MNTVKINIQRTNPLAPCYTTEGAAGADLYANNDKPVCIGPSKAEIIPTGIRVEIPVGYEIQIRPRSGLAFKHGITVLNSPGTIDSDYRGEVKVILFNHGKQSFSVKKGDRIAQIIVGTVVKAEFIDVESVNKTVRGEGGFGSTGT